MPCTCPAQILGRPYEFALENALLHDLLLGLFGMPDIIKLDRRILTSHLKHNLGTARMIIQEFCHIIYLPAS
jgi:hypothetical protein